MEYKSNPALKTIKTKREGNPVLKGKFVNSSIQNNNLSLFSILKWKLSKNPQAEEKKNDNFKLTTIPNNSFLKSYEDMIIWLGHASFFIRINDINILIDPVFFSMPGFKRLSQLPCNIEEFIDINYLLISHFHRDHFDKKSVSILCNNNPGIEALIPLAGSRYFNKMKIKTQEAAWYQKYDTEKIEVLFLPAKHWHKRSLNDTNKVLWGSFIIKSENTIIYFAGDTAYGNHFADIQKEFSDIDYCILPIGAYKPEYIMKDSHMAPKEALKAFTELGGKTMIPMHYGTFDLSDEPLGEPYRVTVQEANNYNIKFMNVGEELKLKLQS